MRAETIARLERKIRPIATRLLPPHKTVELYSSGRKRFLEMLSKERMNEPIKVSPTLGVKLWGINFPSSLMNAAGMFKNGECAELMSDQGAGAYLCGTTTYGAREGNQVEGVWHPFTPLPFSNASLNKLGLPNLGHEVVAGTVLTSGNLRCPKGASVALDDNEKDLERSLEGLVFGMREFEKAGVDFIEVNVSCPNTGGKPDYSVLEQIFSYLDVNFIKCRRKGVKSNRNIPVVAKLSLDVGINLNHYLEGLMAHGFDGVTVGNTSTKYDELLKIISKKDERLFRHFTEKYKGGFGGAPLKEISLGLAAQAVKRVENARLGREFNVIRTGGVENAEDIMRSKDNGIFMNQWFTGYWEAYSKSGNNVYKNIYQDLLRKMAA